MVQALEEREGSPECNLSQMREGEDRDG